MALGFAHGAVQWMSADAVNTTYAVTGLGFAPKAIRLYCLGLQSSTDAASQTVHWRSSVGFALSASNRRCVGAQSQDNVGTQVCTTGYREDAVLVTFTSTPGADGLLDVSSFDADGFTLIVDDTAPADLSVFWEAWGGSDLTQVYLDTILEPASTGTVEYAAANFRPDIVLFAGAHGTGASPSSERNDAAVMVGAASGTASAENIVAVCNDDDASATSDCDRLGRAGDCIAMVTVGGGAGTPGQANLSALSYRGFTLNWAQRAVTNRRYIYLAMKGGAWKVGSTTIAGNSASATATVTTSRGGVEFAPLGLSFMGISLAQSGSSSTSTQAKISLGSASSAASRRSQGLWSEDANASQSEIDLTVDYDSCLSFPDASGVLTEALDVDAMLSNGFRLIVDSAGGVASEWVGYVACGNKDPELSWNNFLGVSSASSVNGRQV